MLERSDPFLRPETASGLPLGERFRAVRQHSTHLAAPLSDEDCLGQSMPDASPTKWHLAHTTWFFETFILERYEPRFRPFHQAFRVLFNSYYNGVGEMHPRPERGLLTRPALAEVRAYRENVDGRVLALLAGGLQAEVADTVAGLVELGLQHEQQHQELILTDLLHLLSRSPILPAYDPGWQASAPAGPCVWYDFEAAIVRIGHGGDGFCFDNELPRHRQFVEPFSLASRLVTNAEYAGFIAAGGYADASLWLSEGWSWVQAEGLTHPLYWRQSASGWQHFGLAGLQALVSDAPVLHLSYFEASAYANFAGARLPTETEWEHAAQSAPLEQLYGPAWQWTSSAYAPYPGFAAAAGAIGEYNGKFMVNQYVLRGGSLATPAGHSRPTYRNFFPATARWQFSGIRLAR